MGFLGQTGEWMSQCSPVALAPIATVATVVDTAGESLLASVASVVGEPHETRCPQDGDCPAGGLASRIFECQEGCGFRGCCACMEIHEAEPHASDSMNSFEMARNSGACFER